MGVAGFRLQWRWRLERIGWSNAEFWMRRQAYYDLAQERRRLPAVSA